jgi:glyceraldehyde 3-phosphate dehydrogenase
MKKTRIFINGFGRIGRSAARIILEDPTLELVGINDLYAPEQMAYLLKYDSVYDTLPQDIKAKTGMLWVDTQTIVLYAVSNPSNLDLHALHIDVMLQCSGIFLTVESNQPYINNGVSKVIVSTPPSDAMPTYICGVNANNYQGEPIISNSSCSANAIVPIFKTIDKLCGIRGAQMHMFHSYTAYQNLLDAKHYSADTRRARAAAVNVIPLSSSAAKATAYFFPKLVDHLHAKSIRIPVTATTMYDLLIKLEGSHTLETVRERLIEEIETHYEGILSTTCEPKVSSDYIADTYSATIDLPLLDIAGENLLRVSAWQDNEYGYACRLVEMAKRVCL